LARIACLPIAAAKIGPKRFHQNSLAAPQ
jgi:hypothetical protein